MRFTVPNPSEALLRELRVSQAVQRVRQLPTVFVANPLLAAFVAVVYWDHVFRTLLVIFVAAQAVLWTPAILSWRRLRNRARPTRVSPNNEKRALVFSISAGLLWGAAAFALYPAGGTEERTTLVMLLTGLCAGSVSFFSSSPYASLGFWLPFMLSLLVQALTFMGGSPVLPAAIAVFTVSAFWFTRTSWAQFVENVGILVERDRLLQEAKASGMQLELMLSRMSDLAMVDELTGLKNRRSFFDDIEPVIAGSRRRGKPVAIALLDLDHFKDINDTHGHAIGDDVLRTVARRIEETLRQEQIVGRIGGEEFVVLLPDTTPQQALVAIERVRKAVGETPIAVTGGSEVWITVSGGISPLVDGMVVPTALQHADKAMYRAKALGRNRVEVFGEVAEALAG
ncbi:MAG: diguanylate cyclase [Gemmatimonadaceae bacterium]|nr:diguanylate cyclase [Gemmatimonadaceae bacterium]